VDLQGWLTRDDLIIDIAADQVADAPAAVNGRP
jgi:hypothetical protein